MMCFTQDVALPPESVVIKANPTERKRGYSSSGDEDKSV